MSGEREAADSSSSRLATPPAAPSSPEEPAAMGDVLAKEEPQHCSLEAAREFAEGSLPAAAEPQRLLGADMAVVEDNELTVEAVLNSQDSIEYDKSYMASDLMSILRNYENTINNGVGAVGISRTNKYVQCREQCLASGSSSSTPDDLCDCKECKWKKSRDLSKEDFEEILKCKQLGVNLSHYIRSTFHWFMETSGFSANPSTTLPHQPGDLDSIENLVELRKSVVLLCEKVPYQLFMWLVGQAQEFVIGVKVQLLTLLYDRSFDNLAEVFITKLLDGYEALLATAVHISDLLEPLQNELFSKVNLTWGYINKSLYQNYVFSDPLIQNNLPSFLGQLKECMKEHNSKYKYLLDRYFTFNDEITKIGSLCPEIERLIDKYKDEKLEFIKETDDSSNAAPVEDDFLYTNSYIQAYSLPQAVEIQSMFNDWKKSPQQRLADLVEALTSSSVLEEETESESTEERKYSSPLPPPPPPCLEKTVKEGINKSVSYEKLSCKCDLNNFPVDSGLSIKQEKSQNLQNNALGLSGALDVENRKVEPAITATTTITAAAAVGGNNESSDCPTLAHHVLPKLGKDSCKESLKKMPKTATAQMAQTQLRHSTTQTPSTNHNQNHVHRHYHQGRCSSHSHLHGSLSNSVIKSSGLHRTHVGHNIHPPGSTVTCHKQQHIVEHIKRLSAIDLSPGENGDCSDSGSSHEDACSATNSPTPRDSNRHCDCCYCEVFGHGVPSVAPVSRNYNEMRERLRQLLSKKKAKVCKTTATNPHAKCSVEVSLSSSSLSSTSSTSSTITNVDSANLPNPASRSNTPITAALNAAPKVPTKIHPDNIAVVPAVPVKSPKEDLWSLDAAVEFIEGSNGGKKNEKKAAKKARQKQRKLEEKIQQQKEEDNRMKLIELQKKTPEVTITVVNPQKQPTQRSVQQQRPKLPEVSIIPAVLLKQQTAFTASKQTNVSAKKNTDVVANNSKSAGKGKSAAVPAMPALPTEMENVKKKTANVEKVNQTSSANQAKSKTSKKFNEVVPQTNVDDEFSDLSNLTKKERKKLRREMKKQEELKKELENKQSENQLQIVTIKRIMESNSAEPTVTITLKGQTPAEDKVLFTLVNGQTKDSANEKSGQSQSTGKKKKNKGNNSASQSQQGNAANKSQQSQISNGNVKNDVNQKNNSKNSKQQQSQQQTGKDKSKMGKQQQLQEEQKTQLQQQNISTSETKSTKSKKDKKKNNENKENIMKQTTTENLQKQETNVGNKKSNKAQSNVAHTQSIGQKQQQQQQQQHQQQQQQQLQQHQSNSNNKNTKNIKNQNQVQNQNQNQNQNQKKTNNNSNNQNVSNKAGKNNNANNSSQNHAQFKVDNQKTSKVAHNTSNKPKQNFDPVQSQKREQAECFPNNHHKETNNTPVSINIENLKLPPGITITKVDAPVKPLPIKTNSAPKPINNTPKQTTIIAAPMSGMQSSNYGNSQSTGNVIVVDTGRLMQDLIPKNEASKDTGSQSSSSSKKKKKKKNKNSATSGSEKSGQPAQSSSKPQQQQQQQQQKQLSNDYTEPARILHNPATNMVTIRNPAFGPAPPIMEPCPLQPAIIKVGENGMVTIRSPVLQQAINAGMQPPLKPDFIVKGRAAAAAAATANEPKSVGSNVINSNELLSGPVKGSNGMSTDITELRRRLAQQSDNDRTTSSTLFNNGLSSIQISKVTNGQSPNIPENGINLKGTSVTLMKIRNTEPHNNFPQQQQQQPHVEDSKGNSLSGNACKNRKKKKRGSGGRQGGDDWNLVESVFTPKDIDLEDGEMDETERELEAFKRFCLQSVPPPRKEKVNLNIKDIVFKKKSSGSPTAAAASAAATAAAVVAAI